MVRGSNQVCSWVQIRAVRVPTSAQPRARLPSITPAQLWPLKQSPCPAPHKKCVQHKTLLPSPVFHISAAAAFPEPNLVQGP